jgi:predicted amidohydrolase YtcJ
MTQSMTAVGPKKGSAHERAKGTYAFRSLLDSGAVLAFGSDWYVAPMEPLMGIYAAAVTRRTLDGKHPQGWIVGEKITVAEAVKAYTPGSAYAGYDERMKGSIKPGSWRTWRCSRPTSSASIRWRSGTQTS